jgi:DNA-directed RNA polymerase subunit RPC12/RpoP
MSVNLSCHKCGADLEDFNTTERQQIFYCPHCGVRVLKAQRVALLRKVTDGEMDDMIRGRLLDVLQQYGGNDLDGEELASRAWESENCDGVVFYNNREADLFAMRHSRWVDEALEYAGSSYGDSEYYVKMKTECNDRFLVVAFILATEYFVYCQLGASRCEGQLTMTRIRELRRMIKTTSYDGGF